MARARNALPSTILFNTSEAHQSIAVAISQMWKQKLGVETTLANMEWQTFLDARGSQQYELARAGWCADYNEASSFPTSCSRTRATTTRSSRMLNTTRFWLRRAFPKTPWAEYQAAEAILQQEFPSDPDLLYATVFMQDDTIIGWPFENARKTGTARICIASLPPSKGTRALPDRQGPDLFRDAQLHHPPPGRGHSHDS